MIRIAGGRNTIFFTTQLLIVPALGTGIALQDQHTPLWVFQWLALLSGLGGDPMTLKHDSGSLFGKIPAGSETWIQNAACVWLLLLVPMVFATWFGMNNIRTLEVSPNIGSPINAFSRITGMLLIGFSAGFALSIKVVFGFQHIEVAGDMTRNVLNLNAPSALILRQFPGTERKGPPCFLMIPFAAV